MESPSSKCRSNHEMSPGATATQVVCSTGSSAGSPNLSGRVFPPSPRLGLRHPCARGRGGSSPAGLRLLAPEMAGQAGWREGKPLSLGDGHDSAGVGGGIHLELEGRGGFHLGEKRGELGFGHGIHLLTLRL